MQNALSRSIRTAFRTALAIAISGTATSVLTLVFGAVSGCGLESAPEGLRRTPPGTGPQIVFDLQRDPLPEIPFPNDVATFADPSSRTGRRVTVSLVSPTEMESNGRESFNAMEGFGTFAPISVSFTRGQGDDDRMPALDLDDLRARMQADDLDFANDAVYLVNLKTGVPVALDLGTKRLPLTVADPALYYENDTHASEQNLIFETREEAPGAPPSFYDKTLDTDFDGVMDHAPAEPLPPGGIRGVDDLGAFYERETDTLLVRPLLPLEEMTEYAVVLTDRLVSPSGESVRSPFPYIHHPQQRDSVAQLRDVLTDASKQNYFGDIAGTGLERVAFAWTFTTEPVYDDLRILRDGLYGQGPFGGLAQAFPAIVKTDRAIGLARNEEDEGSGYESDPRCQPYAGRPYLARVEGLESVLEELTSGSLPVDKNQVDAIVRSLRDNVEYFVTGSFQAPYYLGDPDAESVRDHFELDFTTGRGRVSRDRVPFWIAVPKAQRGFKAPFPTVAWAQGTGLFAEEMLVRAGYFAQHGLAMMSIDMPGHGLVLEKGIQTLAQGILTPSCMVPLVNGLAGGRARDLNGDGKSDSGGLLWTAHLFHSRDNIRQSVLDLMQATRVLRAFGKPGEEDYDRNGTKDLMGDFNADGTPDIGANAPIFIAGNSYGGIVSQVAGALDPNASAVFPISGAGGLAIDIAARSALVVDSVVGQVLTPIVISVPADARPPVDDEPQTKCQAGERSVRLVVMDIISGSVVTGQFSSGKTEMEVACLRPDELGPDMTVVVTNVRSRKAHCATTGQDGRFRIPVAANRGDRLDIQVYPAKHAVDSYASCRVPKDTPVGRRIQTWEQAALKLTSVADENATCEAEGGCQQFQGKFYGVGDPLVAPQEGLGLHRQSPEVRRLLQLAQAAIDPSDPVNFAPYYMLKPLPGIDGVNIGPRAVMSAHTVGDPFVPVAGNFVFARAAGALPFLSPGAADRIPEYAPYATPPKLYDLLGSKTPEQVAIDYFAIEGLARLERTPAGPACTANYVPSATCATPPSASLSVCRQTLADVDWFAEGVDRYDAQHPPAPLRLARDATERGGDLASLERSWAPRLAGSPGRSDSEGWAGDKPLVGIAAALIHPNGAHVWVAPNPCKAFDDVVYFNHLAARFLATHGRDYYPLTHPASHRCLAAAACEFFQ